jgi:hypothetical protein
VPSRARAIAWHPVFLVQDEETQCPYMAIPSVLAVIVVHVGASPEEIAGRLPSHQAGIRRT